MRLPTIFLRSLIVRGDQQDHRRCRLRRRVRREKGEKRQNSREPN